MTIRSGQPTELWQMSAADLMRGYAARAFSPVEVAETIFARIRGLDPSLRAYLALNEDEAMAAARRAEAVWRSPGEKPSLCGVPVSVKDTIEMAGLPTTYGSLAFKDNHRDDAELVRRLRSAGAVLLGKTNTPEFALHPRVSNRLSGPGANPWNLEHTCGGSSGGAAAAVAAGLGPIAIGTDSAGSIRLPAAYNGIFGIKPTFQRIPSVQAWRASPARSHNGPLTRTVRDSALLMRAIAGPDRRDPDSLFSEPVDYLAFSEGSIRGCRVAVSPDFGRGRPLEPELERSLAEASNILASLGCAVVEADPPIITEGDEMAPGVWAYSGDHYGAAESLVPGFWERHKDDLTEYAYPIYDAGRTALAWQYRKILRRNRAFHYEMRAWFENFDYLLSPVTGAAPPIPVALARDDRRGVFGYLAPFNHAYNPAASIPMGFDDNGLPIGVQIVGRHGDDVGVLRVCALMEGVRPWADVWPDVGLQEPASPAIDAGASTEASLS